LISCRTGSAIVVIQYNLIELRDILSRLVVIPYYTAMCSRDYNIFNEVAIPCSGHGSCLSLSSTCLCDTGWTARSDFEISYTFDCDINISAIRILGIISAITSCLSLLLGVINLSTKYLPITRRKLKEPKVVFTILAILSAISGGMYSILKAIDPEVHISSPDNHLMAITLVCYHISTMWALFYFAATLELFLHHYMNQIDAHTSAKSSKLVRAAMRLSYIVTYIVNFYFIFPLLHAFIPHSGDTLLEAHIFVNMVLFGVTGSATFIISVIFTTNLGKYIRERDNSDIPKGLSLVYWAILGVTILTGLFAIVLVPVHIPFAFSPYLRRKYTYLQSILVFLSSQAGFLILLSQTKKNNAVHSIRRMSLNDQSRVVISRFIRRISVVPLAVTVGVRERRPPPGRAVI
jgi:uncharacterized membrane protein (DUF485 family)